jgi:hypothetical protein
MHSFITGTEYILYEVQAEAKENVDDLNTIIKHNLSLAVYKLTIITHFNLLLRYGENI